MTGFAAAVACLSSSVEWAAVGRSAVPRNMAKLAAGIALHSLSLTIARVVVRSAALVACRSTRTAIATTESASVAATHATASRTSGTRSRTGVGARVGAGSREMTRLATGVAATAGGTSAQA